MHTFKFPLILAALLALTACKTNFEDPAAKSRENMDRIQEDHNRRMKQIMDDLDKNLDKILNDRGQPANVDLSGVIVEATSLKLDSRISLVVKAGLDKNGKPVEIKETNKPKLSAAIGQLDLSNEVKDTSLINIGCGALTAKKMANELGLDIKPLPAAETSGIRIVSANTVMICGPNPLTDYFLAIKADRLILNSFEYKAGSDYFYLSLAANTLTLRGASSITSQGETSEKIAVLTQTITIQVAKQLEAQSNGSLGITAIGGNVAKAK